MIHAINDGFTFSALSCCSEFSSQEFLSLVFCRKRHHFIHIRIYDSAALMLFRIVASFLQRDSGDAAPLLVRIRVMDCLT